MFTAVVLLCCVQVTVCLALESASWCLDIGGFLNGTEREGESVEDVEMMSCVNLRLISSSCDRRLHIEDLETRIAMLPLLQAEQDRR